MESLYRGLGHVMRFCYYNIGFESYALALLWFALFVKLILLPFGIKQQKVQIKGARLRPKLYAIEKKYAGRTDHVTLQKKQQEIMAMQQEEGYSPLSGCLPMLIQLPLILILYKVIQQPISYLCMLPDKVANLAALVNVENVKNEIEIIGKLMADNGAKLTEAISLGYLEAGSIPDFGLFGNFINLAVKPEFWSWALLIPALVFISQFFSMKLTRLLNPTPTGQATTRETEMSMRIMDFAMPAMTLVLGCSLPAALGLYWIYQAVLGIIQIVLLSKFMPLPTFTEEELREAERALRGKAPKRRIGEGNGQASATTYVSSGNRPRSLHHIDDDDDDLPPIRRTPQAPQKPHHANGGNGRPSQPKHGIASAPVKSDKNDNTDTKNH